MTLQEKAMDLLRSEARFVLTTHMASDGDGVGSQLALGRGLKHLGREVTIVNPTPVPANLRFLLRYPAEILTIQEISSPEALFKDACVVILDMGAFDRLAAVLPWLLSARGLIVVDHHPMDLEDGVHYLLDVSASATGEVTERVLEDLEIPLSLDIAEPLYVAIHTDTGGFRYSGTTPATHQLAARLLETGVDSQRIYTELFERQSAARLQLTGKVLSTLKVSGGGKIASMELRDSFLKECGATPEEADDLVNYTLLVDGVVAGFYFKEIGAGKTKVSCRSRGDFAINEFVGRWGGGGHQHAAGLRLEMPLEDAQALVLGAARAALEK